MQMLGELGYEGPLSLYAHPSRYAGRTREAIVQEARAALDELVKAANESGLFAFVTQTLTSTRLRPARAYTIAELRSGLEAR